MFRQIFQMCPYSLRVHHFFEKNKSSRQMCAFRVLCAQLYVTSWYVQYQISVARFQTTLNKFLLDFHWTH